MNDINTVDLPKGIQSIIALPDDDLSDLWASIIVDDAIRKRLLSQAVLNFSMRPKISRTVLPLHGVLLLVGPPGTGKTSLAKGLATKVAEAFKSADFKLIEIEAHGLTSSAMGKTQRAVANLFSQTIPELASSGPTIVLLDEVETLAVDRTKLSLDANPVDIHRATDAVLVQLDLLAETYKNLLFIATSNFPEAVDSAEEFVGLDGRTIRKAVANALASDTKIALNPELVTIEHLVSAAQSARNHRAIKGAN